MLVTPDERRGASMVGAAGASTGGRNVVGGYLARKVDAFRERRRMKRIRRDPAALISLLRSATTILIVCHGNIIRSPFAARRMAQMLAVRRRLAVISAGLEATPGRPAEVEAIVAASRLGVDLRDHAAAAVTAGMVARADVIFGMDVLHLVAMRHRFPSAHGRTFLLAALCRHVPLEIRDPFGGDAATIHDCYLQISRAVTATVTIISQGTDDWD
jgi:protein-tyrosine-phosphatase